MEFVSWDDDIPNIWKVIKIHGSKPPTRLYSYRSILHNFTVLFSSIIINYYSHHPPTSHVDIPRCSFFFRPQRSQVLQVLQASQVRRVARQELGHVVVGGFHGVQVRLGTDNGRSSEICFIFLGENMVKLWKKWEILGWSSSIILVNIEEYWTYENIINWYHQLSDKNDWNHQAGKVWTSRAIKKKQTGWKRDGKWMKVHL